MFFPFTAPMLAFMYRLRGGGFVSLTVTECRVIWAASIMLAQLVGHHAHLLAAFWVLVAGYVSMLIPHAFCQNMGKWPTPQKGWPTFFFPTLTGAEWTEMSTVDRAIYDALQMACVAFLRGVLVFAPLAFFGFSVVHVLVAIAVITALQPIGYLIGAYVMSFSIPSLAKFSTEWGEFFNGLAWAVSFIWG